MKRSSILWLIIHLVKNIYCSSYGKHSHVLSKNAIFNYVPTSITYDVSILRRKFGGDLPTAVFDVVEGFPISELAIAYDNHTGKAVYLSKKTNKIHPLCFVQIMKL